MTANSNVAPASGDRHFAVGLGRAFAGALLFSIALLMTMEMWWIGFYIAPLRLALFTLLSVLLLVRIAHDRGFEKTLTWRAAVIDAFVGYGVGFVTAALVLPLLGVITWGMSWDEIVGKVAIQAIPGAIGALLARSQLGQGGQSDKQGEDWEKAQAEGEAGQVRYGAELFTMIIGALFIAFNVAPTEEMALLSYMMTPWHALALVLVSLALLHVFVYEVDFRGQHQRPQGMGFWTLFLRFTVVGYALMLLVCLYLLWNFGRLDSTKLFRFSLLLGAPRSASAPV